jgi:hypothetical protein
MPGRWRHDAPLNPSVVTFKSVRYTIDWVTCGRPLKPGVSSDAGGGG